MLDPPDNGRLECSGPDTDRTCEVRFLGLWREFLLSLRYPVGDRRDLQFFLLHRFRVERVISFSQT